MSRRCAICDKGPHGGSSREPRARNLDEAALASQSSEDQYRTGGKVKAAYVCASCIRTGKVRKVI